MDEYNYEAYTYQRNGTWEYILVSSDTLEEYPIEDCIVRPDDITDLEHGGTVTMESPVPLPEIMRGE